MSQTITMEELKKRLQQRQCKLTTQRQTVLQIFIDHPEKHLSAEDVYALLKADKLEIGLATVYRSLELLSELSILHKIDFGDGRTRYELNAQDAKTHQHHHLICVKCGRVTEFAEDLLETLEQDITAKSSFKILDHQVKFYGYCQECQSNGEN